MLLMPRRLPRAAVAAIPGGVEAGFAAATRRSPRPCRSRRDSGGREAARQRRGIARSSPCRSRRDSGGREADAIGGRGGAGFAAAVAAIPGGVRRVVEFTDPRSVDVAAVAAIPGGVRRSWTKKNF